MFQKYLSAAAVVAAFSTPVSAATYQLTATALFPDQNSDFSIEFDDLDGDQKLSFDEVTAFSGYASFQLGRIYLDLLRVSPEPDETDEPLTFTSGGFPIRTWLFGRSNGDRAEAQPSSFTYELTQLTHIPLPASAVFLLAGLGGLGVMGARRRR